MGRKNCPELLGDENYTYALIRRDKNGEHRIEYTQKYSSFLRHEDKYGEVFGRFDWPFLEYDEMNFGVTDHEEED